MSFINVMSFRAWLFASSFRALQSHSAEAGVQGNPPGYSQAEKQVVSHMVQARNQGMTKPTLRSVKGSYQPVTQPVLL